MAKHLSPRQYNEIIDKFTNRLIPMITLANEYGLTRQGVWKILARAGVNTSKSLGNTRLEVSCTTCGKIFIKNKAHVRNNKNLFCSRECYTAYLEAGNGVGPYIKNRHGQRIARTIVSEHFELKQGHVVHHKDRNCLNNLIENLMVFATQGDHIRFHRLGPDYVHPIWEGDAISP
jgi:hypothetical protein